jgi:hypothetical protein
MLTTVQVDGSTRLLVGGKINRVADAAQTEASTLELS